METGNVSRDNNPIKMQKTGQGKQWIFNAADNPAPGDEMDATLGSETYK